MSIAPNKVDMSLDEIIKITKSEKRKQARKAQARGGRAARGQGGARGAQKRGRGVGGIVGRGKAVRQTLNRLKQIRTNLQRGRRGQGRGRNDGVIQQSSGVNPFNRNSAQQANQQQTSRRGSSIRGQGRGRGRGMQRNQLVFTNSNLQSSQRFSVSQQDLQRQRLDSTRQQAALLKEKQLALKNLQQAQKNMQTINLALQKTSRENLVNQRRGTNNPPINQQGGRGRRKLLANLKRQPGNSAVNSVPARLLTNTSVTITNPTALNPGLNHGNKKRQWRRNNNQVLSEQFTIHVANQNQQPVRQQNSVLDQLKNLKPSVSTTYKFQKNVFAAPATGVSLSDRFSGAPLNEAGDMNSEGRKVFI